MRIGLSLMAALAALVGSTANLASAQQPTNIASATSLTIIPTKAPITITESTYLSAGDSLSRKIGELDAAVFDAYNRCELKAFGDFIATDAEFFHDNAGLMLGRANVVDATEKYICGKVRRELVAGSLRVYPIKDYGAIAIGEHRFCETPTNECVGIAKFTNVWRSENGAWQMTRILSYDHQPFKK
jgi:Domain of unknown function (DUF4440)